MFPSANPFITVMHLFKDKKSTLLSGGQVSRGGGEREHGATVGQAVVVSPSDWWADASCQNPPSHPNQL